MVGPSNYYGVDFSSRVYIALLFGFAPLCAPDFVSSCWELPLNPVEVFGLFNSPLLVATIVVPCLDLLGIDCTAFNSKVGFSRNGVIELLFP